MIADNDAVYIAAEAAAWKEIDRQPEACGWSVQSVNELNLNAKRGVAVRELVLKGGHGRADYLLYVDGEAVGAIETKERYSSPSDPSRSAPRTLGTMQ